ncbi:phage NinH family protein [Crocinitomicaceae bacterium]|nr:phage NinH family protein [Crocinitomicaceae bacterium]
MKIVKTLNSILVDTCGNQAEAARRLQVNRGSLSRHAQSKTNAYLVDEDGYVYKRTGKKYKGMI